MQQAKPEADRQLPLAGEIFLDHVGHFVRDPQAASDALARAGFAPTPPSVQTNPDPAGGTARPTGTGNVTAMLARGYLEVLFKTADTPLGQELDAALARYPGLHLAAFAVDDATDAHQRLRQQGFRVRPLVDMRRPVETDDGFATAAFTIARVEPGEMREGRIQILTHRTEHAVWQRRWLSHPNGAIGLSGVIIAVADVEETAARFARFTGRDAMSQGCGQTILLDRGRIDLFGVDEFARMLPELPIPSLPFIAAYRVRVGSLATIDDIARQGGLRTRSFAGGTVAIFPAELGVGAWLFEQ